VGPSGCGKSTAVALLERFYDPDGGAVLLDGCDLRDLQLRWLRAQIGLVSQEPVLFSGSIFDNIACGHVESDGGQASRAAVEAAAKMANAHDFISGFPSGYDTEVGEKGVQLSGGQKQRIAIARAVVRDPSILILDEATSALDANSEKVVQAALDGLLKEKKRTTIIIAHRLSTIRNADKIVVLKDGEVAEIGTHESLMAQTEPPSFYSTLVNMQMSASAEDDASTFSADLSKASPPIQVSAANVSLLAPGTQIDKTVTDVELDARLVAAEQGATLKATNDGEIAIIHDTQRPNSFAWIWELSVPERPYLYWGLLGAALIGCGFPLLGYFLAEMIAVFFNPDPDEMREDAEFWALLFVGMAVTQAIGALLAQYCFGVITERLARRVRDRSFVTMLRQDMGWYDDARNSSGALATRLASDCAQIKALTGERASTSTSQVVTLTVAFGVAFYQCWEMTLVMLGLIPLIAGAFGVQASFVQGGSADSLKSTNAAGAEVSEAVLNVRTVGAYGLEGFSAQRFSGLLDLPLKQFTRKGFATGFGIGMGNFVILSGAGLAYYVGGQLYLVGRATFAEIMAVILCVMFGAVGLGQFAADASDKAEALGAAEAIRALWDRKPAMDAMNETKGKVPSEPLQGELEFRDVSFSYPMRPDQAVYRGLNLKVKAGETIALVGPSGCGKSTAVALLERFYDPDGGAVLLDGCDLRDLQLRWLRAQIGLVSQEPVLFSGSIFDNIACGHVESDGGQASRAAVEAAAKMANAHDFISGFPSGYDTEVGEKGVQLSGGQKQRIAIARAVVRDPSILILDEATSALDANSEKVVQAALDGLLKEKKRTTIIIAHRLSTIRNADRIVVFMDGTVVEQGTHNELMRPDAAGHYRALVTSGSSAGGGSTPAPHL